MSHFIKLTHKDGELLVNMDRVLRVWPNGNGCALKFEGEEPLYVKETLQRIIEKL